MKPTRYAFNVTREAFLSLDVHVADTPFARLRGFIGKMKLRSDEALWVVPSRGIHTIGVLFPLDVIYLDSRLRVLRLKERLRPLRITSPLLNCASVLAVRQGIIEQSGTQVGDRMMVALPAQIEEYISAPDSENSVRRQPKKDRTLEGRSGIG